MIDLIYLGFLLLRGHDQELGCGVDNLELADNGGGIIGHKQLLHMVDNDLVATCAEEQRYKGSSVDIRLQLDIFMANFHQLWGLDVG